MRVALLIGLVFLSTPSCAGTCGDAAPVERCVAAGGAPSRRVEVLRGRGVGGVVARLAPGWRVEVHGTDGEWSAVRFADPSPSEGRAARRAGWVRAAALSPCQEVLGAAPVGVADAGSGGEVRTCWWNTGGLGEEGKDFDAAARALRRCDVVGLGEVRSRNAPRRLATALGPAWGNLVSERPTGRGGEARDHFAVVFDRRIASLVDGPSGPALFLAESEGLFDQDPWSVRLRAGRLDLRLILVRLTGAERADQHRREAAALPGLLRRVRQLDDGAGTIVLMGSLEESSTGELSRRGDEPRLRWLVETGGTVVEETGEVSALRDQIAIDAAATPAWTGRAGVETDVGLPLSEYRRRVSGRLPVWASFWTARASAAELGE